MVGNCSLFINFFPKFFFWMETIYSWNFWELHPNHCQNPLINYHNLNCCSELKKYLMYNVLLTINNWRGGTFPTIFERRKMLFLISYILLNYLQKGRKFSHYASRKSWVESVFVISVWKKSYLPPIKWKNLIWNN